MFEVGTPLVVGILRLDIFLLSRDSVDVTPRSRARTSGEQTIAVVVF